MNEIGSEIELSVVLPAYAEAENLQRLLPQLQATLKPLTHASEIVVIDTETPRDDTAAVCAAHRVRCIPRSGGSRYGHAVRTALQAVHGKYVIFLDADGSHSPNFLPQLWQHRHNFDVVIASRYVPGGKTQNPFILILLSRAVNLVFRLVLGLDCADVSNSFRLYRTADLTALSLNCDDFDIIEEILIKLSVSHKGCRIKEVPVACERRKNGTPKRQLWLFAVSYLATLRRLYRLKRQARLTTGEENL